MRSPRADASAAAVVDAESDVTAAANDLADAQAALVPLQDQAAVDQGLHDAAVVVLADAQQAHDAAKATYDAIMLNGVTSAEMAAFNDANNAYISAQEVLATAPVRGSRCACNGRRPPPTRPPTPRPS